MSKEEQTVIVVHNNANAVTRDDVAVIAMIGVVIWQPWLLIPAVGVGAIWAAGKAVGCVAEAVGTATQTTVNAVNKTRIPVPTPKYSDSDTEDRLLGEFKKMMRPEVKRIYTQQQWTARMTELRAKLEAYGWSQEKLNLVSPYGMSKE